MAHNSSAQSPKEYSGASRILAASTCSIRVNTPVFCKEASKSRVMLSIFGQMGGGLTVRLSDLHIGGKLLYRFINEIPPATQFEPCPLKSFQFVLFGGVSF